MSIDYGRLRQSCSRPDIANELAEFADETGRVAFGICSDSNGLHTDYGLVGGLSDAFARSWQCFSYGFNSCMRPRNRYAHMSATNLWWPRYSTSNPTGGETTYWPYTNGTSAADGLTVVQAGVLTNYVPRSGDRFYVSAGSSGIIIGEYDVNPATTVAATGTIGITASCGALKTGIFGFVNSASGGTSNSGIAAAYSRGWNFKREWLGIGGGAYHKASGTAFLQNYNEFFAHKNGLLPYNGTMIAVAYSLSETGGATRIDLCRCTIDAGSVNVIANATLTGSGSAATWQAVRATLAASDRTTSHADEAILWGTDLGAGHTGPISALGCALFNGDMTRGVSVSALACLGGASAYDLAKFWGDADDNSIDNLVRTMADQCAVANGGTGTVRCCILINYGFNDQGETVNDYRGDGNPSYSTAGYVSNIRYTVERLQARWNSVRGANASDTELYFAFVPSHPVSDSPATSKSTPPNTSDNGDRQRWTNDYYLAIASYAQSLPKAFAIDLYTALGPSAYARLNDARMTYTKDADVTHLMPAGYNLVGAKIAEVMRAKSRNVVAVHTSYVPERKKRMLFENT